MKIGILTFHYSNNYGAVLQCFALKNFLERLNHEVIIINRLPNKPHLLKQIYYFILKYINIHSSIYGWLSFNKEREKLLAPLTKKYYNSKQLKNSLKLNFDAIIVGSDQIWRYDNKFADYNYYLDYIAPELYPKIKKIAYAASFGLNYWDGDIHIVSQLLSQFKSVSVREESGVDICKRLFSIDAKKVLDPTFLLPINQYPSISKPQFHMNVVSYFLGQNKTELVTKMQKISVEKKYTYIDLYSIGCYSHKKIPEHINITNWLSYIKMSDFIITNSYHAMVFSILYHKNFAIIALESGGTTRIKSALNELDLNSYSLYYDSIEDFMANFKKQEIDWDKTDNLIQKLRKDSIEFIKEALN